VARIDNSQQKRLAQDRKQKEIVTKMRARSVKEMHVGSLIADHDLRTKMKKVKEFLEDGHPVRVIFMSPDAESHEKNPMALDQAILKTLELVEKDASTVQPIQSRNRLRKDLLFNPKPRDDQKSAPSPKK